jgi:DNA ligase-1
VCRATGLSSEELDATFTTDPTASPIRVVRWGHLGDTWPYFRPNFTNMEADRTAAAAQEVRR